MKRPNRDQKIILGGPHATILGQRILEEFDCFDAVVRYEAENVISDFVTAFAANRDLSDILNIIYGRGETVVSNPRSSDLPRMDDLPPAALDLYPVDAKKLNELAIEAERGLSVSMYVLLDS